MNNPFLGILSEESIKTKPIIDLLEKFCETIRSYTENTVDCWLSPSFLTGRGQEYRILLQVGNDDRMLLARINVRASGFPVEVQYEKDTKCKNLNELQNALKDLLSTEIVQQVIQVMKRTGKRKSKECVDI
jgi:hypothetical protein